MASKQGEVEKAFDRILIFREIVRLERRRAENSPRDQRNVDLGIVEPDQPNSIAKEQITKVFNEIELLLEHLHIAHLAASFEVEALARLGNVIGEVRNTIKKSRKSASSWPTNLVRSQKSFEGLFDIEQILSLPTDVREIFGVIRRCRNDFGHSGRMNASPTIGSGEARDLLRGILENLK